MSLILAKLMGMKQNVGPKERYVRLGLGVLFGIGAGFLPLGIAARWVMGVLSILGLGTGATRYCPANQLLGIDRSHRKEETPPQEVSKKVA